jgi:hypothetical protein
MLLIRLSGNWRERPTMPGLEFIRKAIDPFVKALEFDAPL